jgi:peptidoglycan/LPS O-acetylase OafA/YrhL
MARAVERPNLPVLTSLRFWAAALVVLNHLDTSRVDFLPGIIKGWCQSGYEAVTFFFVLSGFILTYVYSSSREDGSLNVPRRRFQIARLARIGPAYYLALVLMLPAFIYGVAVAGIISLDRFVLATLAVPALLQAWLPPVAFSWNGPAWSLSVEMCFYASFPYLLLQTTRVARRDLVLAAAAAVVASAAIRANAQSLLPGYSTEWQYFFAYFPLFHVPSFVFGMALGRLFLFGRDRSPLGNQLSLVLASVVLALVLGFRSSLPAWFVSDALLVPLYGVVILAAAGMHSSTTGILASPVAVLAGEASYSMYILHTPVVFWWHWIAARFFGLRLPHAVEVAVAFALVLVVSIFVFAMFERPLRRFIVQHVPDTPVHKATTADFPVSKTNVKSG